MKIRLIIGIAADQGELVCWSYRDSNPVVDASELSQRLYNKNGLTPTQILVVENDKIVNTFDYGEDFI